MQGLGLQSFPTRRSSDLRPIIERAFRCPAHEGACPAGSKAEFLVTTINSAELIRPEEHTSELQSRFDLVCRLLLEKKNTFIIYNNRILIRTKLYPIYHPQ